MSFELQQIEREAKRDKQEADKAASRTGDVFASNAKRKAALDAYEERKYKECEL